MSIKTLYELKKNEKNRQKLVMRLLDIGEMVRGSFCQIYVKCGKDNCWCKTGKGHLHQRMSFREDGKSHQRAVPKEEYDWIEDMTNRFREFRKLRKDIVKLEKSMKDLLNEYEEEVVKKTKKGKLYLEISK